MPELIRPISSPQPVAPVVQLHTEAVSRVDVTDVWWTNATDRLVSVAIGDDRAGGANLVLERR